jgi:hypothetical protein
MINTMIFDYFYVLYAYIYPYLCTIKPVYRAKADYRTYPPEYRPGGTRPVFRRVNPIYFHPVPRSAEILQTYIVLKLYFILL